MTERVACTGAAADLLRRLTGLHGPLMFRRPVALGLV
jgi:uncharacterized protein (DUF779 family)